jgi:hypothetical protein
MKEKKRLKRTGLILLITLGIIMGCMVLVPCFRKQIIITFQIRRLSWAATPFGAAGWADAPEKILLQVGKQAVPQLVWATHSRNVNIRAGAVSLLAQIGSDGNILENPFDPHIRKKITPILIRLLNDSDEKVKSYAAGFLAVLGEDDPRILSILINSFKSQSAEVWYPAGKILSRIRDKRSLDVARQALENKDKSGELFSKKFLAREIIKNIEVDNAGVNYKLGTTP